MRAHAKKANWGWPPDFDGCLVTMELRIGDGKRWPYLRDILVDGGADEADAWDLAVDLVSTNSTQRSLVRKLLVRMGYADMLREPVTCSGRVYRISDGVQRGEPLEVETAPLPVSAKRRGERICFYWEG